MFGDPDRFAAMKIDMFGQMSNIKYVGPYSFICPDEVMKEFKIGKTLLIIPPSYGHPFVISVS